MFRSRQLLAACLTLVIAVGLAYIPAAGAQTHPTGQLIAAYTPDTNAGIAAAPPWVASATEASLAHLASLGYARDTLELAGAQVDDIGTLVRLNQRYAGLPVFGGQVLAHLDSSNRVTSTGGQYYTGINLNPKATLTAQQAVDAAKAALGYKGTFANTPAGQLMILPQDSATALVFRVVLYVRDGTAATAKYNYFINANDGSVTFVYNALDSGAAKGTGKSLYLGTVNIGTFQVANGTYYMLDASRGLMETHDLRNATSGKGQIFSDADNIWGNSATSSRQSAGVDAHFGAMMTWDYYLNTFGRRGIDGKGFKVISLVHYGRNYNNAFWDGATMTYGDGDGVTFSPLVALDVAGHEITHGLTTYTANLTYAYEPGAANEAFSDIFATMVEFAANPSKANYDIGEVIYTPGTPGDALRSMSNPTLYAQPDHYSKRYIGRSDSGGVHTNSGIQNNCFYLLSEGGTNKTSGKAVTGIGRDKAAAIFYRALTVYLYPSAKFTNVRAATLSAASDLYGATSAEYAATAQAWTAVGVN